MEQTLEMSDWQPPQGTGGVFLSFLGGICRGLYGWLSNKTSFHWGRIAAQGIVGISVGLLLKHIVVAMGHPEWSDAAQGLGGWWGADGVKNVIDRFKREVKK